MSHLPSPFTFDYWKLMTSREKDLLRVEIQIFKMVVKVPTAVSFYKLLALVRNYISMSNDILLRQIEIQNNSFYQFLSIWTMDASLSWFYIHHIAYTILLIKCNRYNRCILIRFYWKLVSIFILIIIGVLVAQQIQEACWCFTMYN